MTQPDKQTQKELLDAKSGKEVIYIPDSKDKWTIRNMKGATIEKLTMLQLKEADSLKDASLLHSRILAKGAAYCILNGLKMHFFHWVMWRYLYYWKGYTNDQFEAIIRTAKKKVQAKSYSKAIIYLTGMRITGLQMTKEEQEQFQQELTSE